MEQNLFDMFGINPQEAMVEVEKKTTKKKAEKKTEKKSAKKEEKYKLPLNVVMGYCKPFIIEETDEKSEVTLKELKDMITKKINVKGSLLAIEFTKDKKTVFATFSSSKAKVKGKVALQEGTRFILPNGRKVSAENLLEDKEETEVTIEQIGNALAQNYGAEFGFGISLTADDKDFIVHFAGNTLNKVLTFPLGIVLFGRSGIKLTEDTYKAFAMENGKEDGEYDKNILIKYIESKYPEMSGHIVLQYIEPIVGDNDEKGPDIVNVNLQVTEKSAAPQIKKILFPTNAKLFVMAQSPIQLEPAMFENKEEVSEDDIIQYASENVSPIFKKGRCGAEFFKEDNYIYLSMKGSKKGAMKVVDTEEEYETMANMPFSLFEYINPNGEHCFVEKNPAILSIYNADLGNGTYKPLFGKLPATMYEQIFTFFEWVTKRINKEALVRVFYNLETKQYEVVLPYQTISRDSVVEQSSDKFNVHNESLIPVAEFHSHNRYEAFFSSDDDADEKMAMVCGVFGGYCLSNVEPEFVVRTVANGHYITLQKSDVFDDSVVRKEDVEAFLEDFSKQAEHKLLY